MLGSQAVSSFNRINNLGLMFFGLMFFFFKKKKKNGGIFFWSVGVPECGNANQQPLEMEGMGGCLFVELATRMVMYVWWLAVRRVRIGTRKAAAWQARKVLTIAFLMYVIMETNASLSLSG